jgi:segregation and condensation protein A
VSIANLELDLDLFSGPFDLLLTLILREEIDLLELELADVVLAYLDHLEARGELDLETATEFIVLVAALLELKSRLMIAGEDDEQLLDIEPGEAAEELLTRMLDASRYRSAAAYLQELLAHERGVRFRQAPAPAELLRAQPEPIEGAHDPTVLGAAIGRLLRVPAPISLHHITIHRVTLGERLAHLRTLLGRGRFNFDDAVAGADRVTVAITLFALLELYKRGEAVWEQPESFGEIQVHALASDPAGVATVGAGAAG